MAEWVNSSFCRADSPQCVQVMMMFGAGTTGVYVRDSKLGSDSPVLGFSTSEWRDFVRRVKSGEFDIAEDD